MYLIYIDSRGQFPWGTPKQLQRLCEPVHCPTSWHTAVQCLHPFQPRWCWRNNDWICCNYWVLCHQQVWRCQAFLQAQTHLWGPGFEARVDGQLSVWLRHRPMYNQKELGTNQGVPIIVLKPNTNSMGSSSGKSKASHFKYTYIKNVLRDPTIFTSREVAKKWKWLMQLFFGEATVLRLVAKCYD